MSAVATIDLPYIETNRSRHKRIRYYFRYLGARICRLPDDPQSEDFTQAYWDARRKVEGGAVAPSASKKQQRPGHPLPNTFRWLCVMYQRSGAFRGLDAVTQTKRRQIIDSMLLEPVKLDGGSDIFADMPIRALTVSNIEKLRDRKKATPFAADERLKILRQVFETTREGRDGTPQKIVKANIALLVSPFRKKTDGHHTISETEIAQYIRHHGVNSKPTLALALLMYVGFRISDLQAIGPRHRRGDTFVFRVFKGRNSNPTTLIIPIHPVLDHVLSLHRVTGLYYLMTEFDQPYSIKGLSQRVSAWFTQADLPHCTAHSVRKGLATNIAENEATDSMLNKMFGWSGVKTSRIYTAKMEQAKLARQAVSRIHWGEIGNLLPHLEADGSVPSATPVENIEENQRTGTP